MPVGMPVPVCGVGAGQRITGAVTRKARFPAVSHNCPFSTQNDFSGKKQTSIWLSLFLPLLIFLLLFVVSKGRLGVLAGTLRSPHLGSGREAEGAPGAAQQEGLSEMERGCGQTWPPGPRLPCGERIRPSRSGQNCPVQEAHSGLSEISTVQGPVSSQVVFVKLYT